MDVNMIAIQAPTPNPPDAAARREARATESRTPVAGPQGEGPRQAEALPADERRELQQLKALDRKVRAHEQAHLTAAGNLVRGGGMNFEYRRGPDGVSYAVGGEVSIDTAPVPGDPQATLQKAEQIRHAALAPADPSSQDRAVAAEATRMAAEARTEILRQGEPPQAGQAYRAVQQAGHGSEAIIDLIA